MCPKNTSTFFSLCITFMHTLIVLLAQLWYKFQKGQFMSQCCAETSASGLASPTTGRQSSCWCHCYDGAAQPLQVLHEPYIQPRLNPVQCFELHHEGRKRKKRNLHTRTVCPILQSKQIVCSFLTGVCLGSSFSCAQKL